jgi:hypothetical protein
LKAVFVVYELPNLSVGRRSVYVDVFVIVAAIVAAVAVSNVGASACIFKAVRRPRNVLCPPRRSARVPHIHTLGCRDEKEKCVQK